MLQQARNRATSLFEVIVGSIAGAAIGLSAFAAEGQHFRGVYHPPFDVLSSAVDYKNAPQIGLLGAMAIGLSTGAAGVKVFGDEKLTYWREAASGHNKYAYYLGKVLSTLFRITLACFHFSVFMGVLSTPRMSFHSVFAANLLYYFCIYGFAHCVSMVTRRGDGPLIADMSSLVIGILGGVAPPLSRPKSWHMEWLWRMSPAVSPPNCLLFDFADSRDQTWFTEIYFAENVRPSGYLYQVPLAEVQTGFSVHNVKLDMWYVSPLLIV